MTDRRVSSRSPMLTLLAPAKINLFLKVGPPRPDGYHPLQSWFVTVGLFDTLTLSIADTSGVHFTCSDPSVPTGDANLVVRAAKLMLPAGAGVTIRLEKHIPIAGGLGGGSSDAAWTLIGMRRLFRLKTDLDPLAASLGSDLNFFLHGPSAICTGRGEIVEPTYVPRPAAALLLLPNIRLNTPDVFRRFDQIDGGNIVRIYPATSGKSQPWTDLHALHLLEELHNNLQDAAFDLAPALRKLLISAQNHLGRPVIMSGSGSSLFTLYDTLAEAEKVATHFFRSKLELKALAVLLCP